MTVIASIIHLLQVVKLDPTSKRWSDTEGTQWMSKDSSSKLETSITKAKKRWSTFGPTMIKLFDKLLLPEGKFQACLIIRLQFRIFPDAITIILLQI